MPPSIEHLRNRNLSIISKSCTIYGHILSHVSQEQAQTWRDQNDAPNGWTALEVLCHVADFDEFFYHRAVMIIEQDYPTLPAYDHNAIAIERAYNQQNLRDVYARFVQSRTRFGQFFQDLSDDQWERAGDHPERGHFTLWDALMQVATHDMSHLEQITRILAEAKP